MSCSIALSCGVAASKVLAVMRGIAEGILVVMAMVLGGRTGPAAMVSILYSY